MFKIRKVGDVKGEENGDYVGLGDGGFRGGCRMEMGEF